METAALVILILAIIIEFVVGVTLNMNILLVYIGNLRKGLSLGPADRIHLTKALLNVSMHLAMAAQYFLYAFWSHLFFMQVVLIWNLMINMILIIYSFWLTTMFCVYYCTNITNCGHRCFVWLKRSLSSYLLHILLVSGLASVAISCPVFWLGHGNPPGNSTYPYKIIQATIIPNVTYKTTVMILGIFLPFAVTFVSTTITSWSLISHIRRMKQNNPGFTCSKLQPQINATRTMVLFLLIFLTYNVMQLIFTTLPDNSPDAVVIIIWFVLISYSILEATIIIQSSSKLRSTLMGKFFNRKRGNSETET